MALHAVFLALTTFVAPALAEPISNAPGHSHCAQFSTSLRLQNTSVIAASFFHHGDSIALPGMHPTCRNSINAFPYANATTDLCRVVINVTTTETSSTIVEAWLPSNWNQRILATGGAGIAGCIDYGSMQYGAQFGFASFGTNCGHNGSSGTDFFMNKPEVLNDFGYRAIHVEAVSAKVMVKQYYHTPSAYNYFAGCSTGGRNAFAEALWYPDDFDGILAGSPGINWLRIVAERGILARRIGWPDINSTHYVREDQWKAIQAAQIALFDGVDGVKDGVIDDPTAFRFNPEALRCGTGVLNESVCLTNEQVPLVRAAYQPLVNGTGSIVYPPFEIGAPTDAWTNNIVNGRPQLNEKILQDFWRSAVFNTTNWNATDFTIGDMDKAIEIDPGRINTWEPNLSKFHARGGKLIVYHGRSDESVTSLLSAEYYDWVQETLNLTTEEMQSFYRLFYIPGMHHCYNGPGSWFVGQPGSWMAPTPNIPAQFNNSDHNILLSLVEWTESNKAPKIIVGTKYENDLLGSSIQSQRVHCPYPNASKWDGVGNVTLASSWQCHNITGAL